MNLYTLLICHLIVLDIILLFFFAFDPVDLGIINVNVFSYGNHLPSAHDVQIKQTVDLVCPPSPTNSILNQSSENVKLVVSPQTTLFWL
jgi:hypothetical protein